MFRLIKHLFAVVFALLLLQLVTNNSNYAYGQANISDQQSPPSDTLTFVSPFEVVITAQRMSIPLKESPAATSVVSTEALKAMPKGIAMDEAMALVPGVKVDNQANGSRVHLSIRGQGILTERGIRGIKTLFDEIPINDPTGFAPDYFDVDFNTIDHIEVLRGPAAALYGGGAAGGIINLQTQNSPNVPLFGQASTTTGSNNFWKGLGQFGGNVTNVNYLVSFSRMIGDGYRKHTHFNGNHVYGKATYTPTGNLELTPIFSWSDTYHENPEGLSLSQFNQDPTLPNDDAIPFNEYLATSRAVNGLTGLINFLDNHEIRFNGYVKRTLFTEANNHVFDHQTVTTPGTSVQYTFKSGASEDFVRNKISVGSDLQWQTIDENQKPNDHAVEIDTILALQQIQQRGVGVFVIDMVELGKQWSLMGSLRFDKIHNELTDLLPPFSHSGSADFSNTTGRLGATFSPMEELSLYGSWGQGFMPPSTNELDVNPDGIGGFNTHLTSATSNSYELGARGTLNHNASYDITGFYMTTDNDFDRYRIPGRGHGTEGTFYRNIAASKRLGVELFATYQPVKSFEIQLAYTYSHFKYSLGSPIEIMMDDTTVHKYILDGNWLPNSPMHQLCFDVRYAVTPELNVGLSSQTLTKTYIDGANIESEAADGYTLLHARASYQLDAAGVRGTITLTGRNLTNQKYAAFTEPDPGGNAYQPGAGREFFVGLGVGL